MAIEQSSEADVHVRARNIAGIDETEVLLGPGVNVLSGRNATNRTSFLQAIMAGLGSERASLKGDADEGEVELRIGEESHTRTLRRVGASVNYGGDPYLDDPELADLFAFLLENNEARQAVARGDDLREIIMRPIDTEEIETDIANLEETKRELDEEIERLERLERELPDLEQERSSVEDELADAREELAAIEASIDDRDADLEESRARKEEIEELFSDLRDARSELEDVEFDLEAERTTLDELEEEHERLRDELASGEDTDEDPERIDGRIDELRSRKRGLDDTLSRLGSVVSFNEELLEGDGLDLGDVGGSGGGAVTDGLVADDDDRTTCWTCGSEVERNRIEETLEGLRELRKEKLSERNDVRDRIDELTEKRSTLRRRRQERQRAERRLDEIEDDIATAERRIEELEDRRETKRETVERLEAESETVGDDDYDEVLELHREANELELRVERLESDRQDVLDRIEECEQAVESRDECVARRESVTNELTELRTRVERIEQEAVESFNDHMASVLDILEYDNIERIWIERREREVREGRRKVQRETFDLHIVRAADDGSSYRDTVDHLSESEREVTGLVFALAGYLVHEVYETVPFMLLDSLEAIDSNRIARVVDYLHEYVGYLVVALLPEDAEALSEEYAYVTEI